MRFSLSDLSIVDGSFLIRHAQPDISACRQKLRQCLAPETSVYANLSLQIYLRRRSYQLPYEMQLSDQISICAAARSVYRTFTDESGHRAKMLGWVKELKQLVFGKAQGDWSSVRAGIVSRSAVPVDQQLIYRFGTKWHTVLDRGLAGQ